MSEWLIAAFAENVGLHISLEYIDCKSLKRLAVRARRSGPEPDRGAGFGRVGEDTRNPDKIVAQFLGGGRTQCFDLDRNVVIYIPPENARALSEQNGLRQTRPFFSLDG